MTLPPPPPDADDIPTRLARQEAALTRIGEVLDGLQARNSDTEAGRLMKQGRGLIAPIAAVVVAFFGAFFLVEARATSISRQQIDSSVTRQQVAEQIEAQLQPLSQQIAWLRESLQLDARLQRIENSLVSRPDLSTPAPTKAPRRAP